MAEYNVAQGDQFPALQLQLQDKNGPVDLTNAAAVTIRVAFPSGVKIYAATVDALQTTTGKGNVTYNFQAGDIPDAGVFRMQTQVTWAASAKETFPNRGFDFLNVTDLI